MNVEQLLYRKDDIELIDVRHTHEWEAGRIEGSRHVPLDELPGRLSEVDHRRPVVAVCRGGPRSLEAADILRAGGLRADSLEGGLLAWAECGLALVTSDGRMGLVVPASTTPASAPDTQAPCLQRGGACIALATASMRDMELAATVAGTAEELGYSTIWVADEPTGNGIEVAAAMQRATTSIRVGLGPFAAHPNRLDPWSGSVPPAPWSPAGRPSRWIWFGGARLANPRARRSRSIARCSATNGLWASAPSPRTSASSAGRSPTSSTSIG